MAKYWLMKSEPSVYSIEDLKRDKITHWEGVRNYQARNFLRDEVKKGDLVLFYHSNAEPPGIAGVAEVARDGYPDREAFNPKSKYFDAKSKQDSPTWYVVDLKFKQKFPELLSLERLRKEKGLAEMLVLRKGQRLSIQPVTAKEFNLVTQLAGR